MSDVFEVVHAQRACRDFAPTPVDDALVARVLDAATFAPSAENRQPWVFVVVRDEKRRRLLAELTSRAWLGGGRSHSLGRLAPALFEDVDRGATGGIYEAPVVVVVGGDSALVDERVLEASVFPAVQNLLLAARALGLGSALTTLPVVFSKEVAELVGFPPEVRPLAVVPIGRPARRLGPPRREPLEAKVHRERFGNRW